MKNSIWYSIGDMSIEKETGRERKYQVIRDKLPRKNEIVDWSENKLVAFLQLVLFFSDGDNYAVTKEKVETFEKRAPEEPFWLEFNVRINRPTFKEGFTVQQFKMRLMTAIRVVLSWLKSNPHAITDEMRDMMDSTARLRWALDPFKAKGTAIGAEIVGVDNKEVTDPNRSNVQPATSNLTLPEVQYHNALLNVASILNNLTKGIKPQEIKKMSVESRIKLADSLIKTMGKVVGGQKPNTQVFKQLVIHNAGRQDLEDAMLEFSQEQ